MHSSKSELIALLGQLSETQFSLPTPLKIPNEKQAVKNPEKHWQKEVFVVLKGPPVYSVGGSLFASRPGTVFLIDRWVPHDIVPSPDNTGTVSAVVHFHDIVWWCLSERTTEKRWTDYRWSSIPADRDLAAFVEKRLHLWHTWNGDPKKGFDDLLRKPLVLMLDDYRRSLMGRYSDFTPDPNSIVDLVKSRIENNNSRNCSMEELSGYSGYSKSRLSHLFKEKTGMTVGQYIDEVRRDYLLDGHIAGLKQKEIAFNLGFKSASAFSTWLRKKNRAQNRKARP